MRNRNRIQTRNTFLIYIIYLTIGQLNGFCKEPYPHYADSIIKLMYDTPSARDTIIHWYDQWVAKCSVPCTDKSISTSQGLTHILVWGDTSNPPIVILHGMQHNATMWLDIVPYLVKDFCLYAPDIICEASGKTIPSLFPAKRADYVVWLKETMDSLKLNNPYLAGISLGSIISMDFAIRYPKQIRKLILISPPGGIVKTRFSAIFKLIIYMLFSGDKWPQKMVDAVRSPTIKSSAELYSYFECIMNHCKQGCPMPWYYSDNELRRIQPETLLLIGSDEIFIKPKAAFARANKYIPHVHTALIKNAGHHSLSDRPVEISGKIIEFCKD
jgi:pimeloyl-ACP methyl ester carboxylesterase